VVEIRKAVADVVTAEQKSLLEGQPESTPESKQATPSLELPEGIMGGVAGEFARLYSAYMESPAAFLFFSYLTCLGSMLSITLASELRVDPRLYLLLLAESGDARKSTAIAQAVKFFFSFEGFRQCHGIGSAEGLQKLLQESGQMLLVFDEFRAFTSKCGIEGSVLMPCVTSLFESDRYESHTSKKSVCIGNARLSLLAACTVETYEGIFSSGFLAIGFPSRLFLVHGEGNRRFSFPPKIPAYDIATLKHKTAEIIKFAEATKEIGINDEARTAYHAWYMALPKSVHARRLETYALRFMLLFCCNEMKAIIDIDVVKKVTALMDWQFRVRQKFDPVDADSNIAKLEEKIKRILAGCNGNGISKRQIQQTVHAGRFGIWAFTQAIQNLVTNGDATFDKKTGYRLSK